MTKSCYETVERVFEHSIRQQYRHTILYKLECGPMPNMMAALPYIDGVLCSTPKSMADAHYYSAMQ